MKIASTDSPKQKKLKAKREPSAPALNPVIGEAPVELDAADFRQRLMPWYRDHARVLPWRGIDDPYATWLSEIMLQQTQVATVQQRYVEFLQRFPTLQSLAEAEPDDPSGLTALGFLGLSDPLRPSAVASVARLAVAAPVSCNPNRSGWPLWVNVFLPFENPSAYAVFAHC